MLLPAPLGDESGWRKRESLIRWCTYCQRVLGERPPFDDPRVTHGICEDCEARLDRGEPLIEQTAARRALMKLLVASASAGDESACAAIIAQALAIGLSNESLLCGMVQPALYQVGLDWVAHGVSVAAEHRFTSWCERVLAMLPARPRPDRSLDLLILSAPGNTHFLGPRIAAAVLAERGWSVEAIVPEVPFEEMITLVQTLHPRAIGFSCAQRSGVPAVNELIARLKARLDPEHKVQFVLSGFAFRIGDGTSLPPVGPGVEVVTDIEAFLRLNERLREPPEVRRRPVPD